MNDLSTYVKRIKDGQVVAFPTETVYGLGADAWNPSAILDVFKTKGRPSDNPLIVHVSSKAEIREFSDTLPNTALSLIDAFWPGPLTLVLKKKANVLDLITSGLDTVAVRMPDHELALSFLSMTGPLVAPSANKSGRPSPTKAEHVKNDFGKDFPVIDGGATTIGLESTVVDLSDGKVVLLRPGKIGVTEIESVLNEKVLFSDSEATVPKSPGQKYSHYKPNAQVVYGTIDQIDDSFFYLLLDRRWGKSRNTINYNGDLEKLSRELYDRFRQADQFGYKKIYVEDLSSYKYEQPSFYAALKNRIEKACTEDLNA
ncbi:MAG: L-threonylcarbamoyladenylate synthase [Gracilimonas sp.]|nr:L-threonylcarbamoyladenylate synthase [Gracilimonas sp.]